MMRRIDTKKAADFLCDSGLLFEINRTLLHPLDLALATVEEPDQPTRFELVTCDDPEGMLFTEELLPELAAKLAKYQASKEYLEKMATRQKALGFIVQPLMETEPDEE